MSKGASQPIIFECDCGATNRSPDDKIPVGWSTRHGKTWCGDCTRLGIPARTLPRRKCA